MVHRYSFLVMLATALSWANWSSAHGISANSSTADSEKAPPEVYISAGPVLSGHWLQTENELYKSRASFGIAGVFGVGAQLSRRVHSGVALTPSLFFPAGLEQANGSSLGSPALFSLAALWLTRVDVCQYFGLRAGIGPQWTRVISTETELGLHSLFGVGGQLDLISHPFGEHKKSYHPQFGMSFLASRTAAGQESPVTGVTSLGGVFFLGYTWGKLRADSVKKPPAEEAPAK